MSDTQTENFNINDVPDDLPKFSKPQTGVVNKVATKLPPPFTPPLPPTPKETKEKALGLKKFSKKMIDTILGKNRPNKIEEEIARILKGLPIKPLPENIAHISTQTMQTIPENTQNRVEIITLTNITSEGFPELEQHKEIDGYSVILVLKEGERKWIEVSLSKQPITYLNQARNKTRYLGDPHLKQILILRGEDGYPLTELEGAYFFNKIVRLVQRTNVKSLTSMKTKWDETPDLKTSWYQHAKPLVVESLTILGTQRLSGTEEASKRAHDAPVNAEWDIEKHELKIHVKTSLIDDNNPYLGYKQIDVTITNLQDDLIGDFTVVNN